MKKKTLQRLRKRVAVIRELQKDTNLKTSNERIAEFKKRTGSSNYTYWTTLKLMRERKVAKRTRQLKRTNHKQVAIKKAVAETKQAMPMGDPTFDDEAIPKDKERVIEVHGMKLRISQDNVRIEFDKQRIHHEDDGARILLPDTWLKQVGLKNDDEVTLEWNHDTGELVICKADG